jgi:hypothetical protein
MSCSRRFVSFLGVLVLLVGASLITTAADAAPRARTGAHRVVAAPGGTADGTLGPAAARALARGPLPRNDAELARGKAGSDRAPGTPSLPSPTVSAISRNFEGVFDTGGTPGDPTGSIGPTRYVELINRKIATYTRTNNVPIASGTLIALTGSPAGTNVFDPQIMWDPTTRRFYYAADAVFSATNNKLAFGFSKSASPNTTSDFCKYFINFGSDFPDFPKLGDTAAHIVLGVNVFTGNPFTGSDILTLNKPAGTGTITTCPAVSTFILDVRTDILNNTGSDFAFTPVPGNQQDPSPRGYVVARSGSLPATSLFLYKVTDLATGHASIQGPNGTAVTVPSYTVPLNAPQQGTSKLLDSSDARPTQAVLAVDPARSNQVALWTQHTIRGGAGARVRWYEINPAGASLFQSGTVSSTSTFVFNAAISPDRQVNGTTRAFGRSMVLNFNTSSTTTRLTISAVSKVGAGAVSAPVILATAPGPNVDFSCDAGNEPVCRWGDYAGASPDPLPPSGTVGQVWGTNNYNRANIANADTDWRTRNFALRP